MPSEVVIPSFVSPNANEPRPAEEALRISEERYRALFNLGSVAIYSIDSAGVIQEFNRRAAELWGREPALGDTDERFCGSYRLFRPDGSFMPHDQCPMAEVVSGKMSEARDAEVLIERPDGSRITVIVNIRPLKNDRGEVIGAINCFYDITERKQAEETNSRLAAIVASSDDAIISKDLNGIITSWNRGAQRIFGYTAQEAIGQSVTLLMPPDRVNEEPGILKRIRAGEFIDHYETVRRRKDGTLLNISLSVSPVRDASGKIIGASKIAHDITERKRAEEMLRRAEQLAASAEIASSLAHEINNPLQSLTNLLALVSYRLAGDKNGSEIAALAEQELERVAHITKHMLALRRETLAPVSLNLTEILDDALEGFTPQLVAKHIKVERRYECSPNLEAFPGEMRQLFSCLIANAAEAHPTKITLHVSSFRDRRSGAENVRVVIADNGTGIPSDLVRQIFDPFATTKERRGTGVGLWVVKNIVTRHRGRVRFRTSTRSRRAGTSFAVFLPQTVKPAQRNPRSDVSKTGA